MRTTLYCAYHRPAPLIRSASVTPIHVGRAAAAAPLPGMIGDDTGDSISEHNPAYCELTALWWAWKNDAGSTHVGLMHYRRLLDFADLHEGDAAELFLPEFRIADYLERTEAWLAANPGVDAVIPKPHEMARSVRSNYRRRHAPEDFEVVRDIVARDHPDWMAAFDRVADGNTIRLA